MDSAQEIFSAEWEAWNREAALAASIIKNGVNALGNAGLNNKGEYYRFLFMLSIGFERLGKLIYALNYHIDYPGEYITDEKLTKLKHDLVKIVNVVEAIGNDRGMSGSSHGRPTDPIHNNILSVLTNFAAANKQRYYNLQFLTHKPGTPFKDAISDWYVLVGDLIITKHYRKQDRLRDETSAQMMANALDRFHAPLVTSETGYVITNNLEHQLASKLEVVIQRWSRVYTCQIIRWMVETLAELRRIAHRENLKIPFLDEHFIRFKTQDKFFRINKVWI